MNNKRLRGYHLVCAALAAHICHRNGGMSVVRIAQQAHRHPSTIRRWLALTAR